jgi:hypothetical protein
VSTTLIATAVAFALAIAAMAIGVMLSGKRLRGSCGGLANLRDAQGRPMCEACSNPSPECRGEGRGRDAAGASAASASAADQPSPRS